MRVLLTDLIEFLDQRADITEGMGPDEVMSLMMRCEDARAKLNRILSSSGNVEQALKALDALLEA